MNTKQLIGIIGATILAIGVFMPIVHVPIMGNMNYFQNGEGVGTIVLFLAIISLILAFVEKYKGLWFTGIGSLIIILNTIINLQSTISQKESEFANNPFLGIVVQLIQFQWGLAVLIIGAVLIIISAWMKEKRRVS